MLATRWLGPADWRILNAIEFVEGGRSYVRRLLNTQHVSLDDLVHVNQLGLITVTVAGYPIVLDSNTVDRRGLDWADLTLTPDAQRLVVTDPRNKVFRTFTILSPSRGGLPVASVEGMTNVDDATLIAMAQAGLLEGVHAHSGETVDLTVFRRLPGMLRLRLTPLGRQYLPYH
jgi:hypothetical protein